MTWDDRALERVNAVAAELARTRALDQIHQQLRQVWRHNVDRYDAIRHGDSPRLIGQMCAENFTNLCLADPVQWRSVGVQVSAPSSSLLLEVGTARLHLQKVPHAWGRQPVWEDFRWTSSSAVRYDAATANRVKYPVAQPTQEQSSLLSLADLGVHLDADCIEEFFVVWAGELTEDALTSAWLGAPTTADGSWLAVHTLWHDTIDSPNRLSTTTFVAEAAVEPELRLRLKRIPGRATS